MLNVPKISRQSIETTVPRLVCQIVLTCLVIRSSAVVVDLLGLAPICVSTSRPLFSASLDILLATITSRVLASVLRRVIGLYALSLV